MRILSANPNTGRFFRASGIACKGPSQQQVPVHLKSTLLTLSLCRFVDLPHLFQCRPADNILVVFQPHRCVMASALTDQLFFHCTRRAFPATGASAPDEYPPEVESLPLRGLTVPCKPAVPKSRWVVFECPRHQHRWHCLPSDGKPLGWCS